MTLRSDGRGAKYMSSKQYIIRVKNLMLSRVFWTITLFGNCSVFLWAFVFHYLEYGENEKVVSFIDSIWWAFATITTVGYGDITPVTVFGKVIGIALMLCGTALFATYTALFANAILGREITKIGSKVEGMQHDEHELEKTLSRLNEKLKQLEKKL